MEEVPFYDYRATLEPDRSRKKLSNSAFGVGPAKSLLPRERVAIIDLFFS